MKELDFDELDRAVNSLMSGVPKSAPVKHDDVKVLTLDAKLPEDAKLPSASYAPPTQPVKEPAQSEVSKSAVPRPASQVASLATRRGGRFMDVVHPSSDMTKSTPAPTSAPARGVSRQGLTIEPRQGAPVSMPAATSQPSSVVEAIPTPAPVVEAEEAVESTNDWPDPLDLSASQAPAADMQESDEAVTNALSFESFAPAADPLEQQAPLTSPFLADAKVEKRPLGGTPASPDTESADVEEPDHSPVLGVMAQDSPDDDSLDDQLPPEPVEADVPLPEELRGDLMAIESDSQPVEPTSDVTWVETASRPGATPTPLPVEASTGPSSIPQQYKEEPSTGDQTSGAIFDTAAYHQPLTHPAKKNSSWMWIVGVIIILLLGAAGGAALYFYRIV